MTVSILEVIWQDCGAERGWEPLPCPILQWRAPSDTQIKLEVQNLEWCAVWLCVRPRWRTMSGQSRGLIHSGSTHEQATIHPPCIHSQMPQGPAALLNSLFIAHSSRLMSSWDLTKWFIRVLRPVGSCSATAEVTDCCQVEAESWIRHFKGVDNVIQQSAWRK